MLGADTNVLVRFLTDDDPVQSPLALRLVGNPDNQPIYICLVALVETVWVLNKVKRRPMADIFAACRNLLINDVFQFEDPELVRQAVDEAERAGCDLADALISLINDRAGCATTVTFDEPAQGLRGMASVESRL